MQCPRCDYIRFKTSPKCVNCGFDFKGQKSTKEAFGELENEFTVFAAVGAQAEAGSADPHAEMSFQGPLASKELTASQEQPSFDEYDSSLELQEAYIQESGDFELDLSGMDIDDSEDWVVGSTLTEDLAEISDMASKETTDDVNEFAVQGLGFDATEDIEPVGLETAPPEQNVAFDSESTVLDEEMAVQEMEPYASKSEIKLVSENEDPALIESSIEALAEEIEPGQSLEAPSDDAGDISLETELELETKDSELDLDLAETESGETSLDVQDNSIELDPMLELEDLDLVLEIENPEAGTVLQGSSQTSDATLEIPSDKKEDDDNAPPLPEDHSR